MYPSRAQNTDSLLLCCTATHLQHECVVWVREGGWLHGPGLRQLLLGPWCRSCWRPGREGEGEGLVQAAALATGAQQVDANLAQHEAMPQGFSCAHSHFVNASIAFDGVWLQLVL